MSTEKKGNKWFVEKHENAAEPIKIEPSKNEMVYIFGCINTVVQIMGKCTTITIDKCTKCGIVFEDIIATVEVVNSKSCQVQCTGKMASITVDKTDGLKFYLSKDSLDCDVITSKSTEVNIFTPAETDDGDMGEHPVPSQFISRYDKEKKVFTTEAVAHVGV